MDILMKAVLCVQQLTKKKKINKAGKPPEQKGAKKTEQSGTGNSSEDLLCSGISLGRGNTE